MNREIKFRGKTAEGIWVYGGFYEWNNKTYIVQKDIWDTQSFENLASLIEVIPETVGQFTNLKDKNGREIYEGDILKEHLCGNKSVVEFEIQQDDEYGNMRSGFDFYGGDPSEDEVIGNIYNNPELKEESK